MLTIFRLQPQGKAKRYSMQPCRYKGLKLRIFIGILFKLDTSKAH